MWIITTNFEAFLKYALQDFHLSLYVLELAERFWFLDSDTNHACHRDE